LAREKGRGDNLCKATLAPESQYWIKRKENGAYQEPPKEGGNWKIKLGGAM